LDIFLYDNNLLLDCKYGGGERLDLGNKLMYQVRAPDTTQHGLGARRAPNHDLITILGACHAPLRVNLTIENSVI